MGDNINYEQPEKWNMAQAFLRRIDALLWNCQIYRTTGQFGEWYKTLDSLYIEISSKFGTDIKRLKVNKILKKATPLVADYIRTDGRMSNEKTGELVMSLRKIDIALHKALDDKGLLTPKAPDARTAIQE